MKRRGQQAKLDILSNKYGNRDLAKRLGISQSTLRAWRHQGTPQTTRIGKGKTKHFVNAADTVQRMYGNLAKASRQIKPERVKERQRVEARKAVIERNKVQRSITRTTIPGDAQYYSASVRATSRKNVLTREAKNKLLREARKAHAGGFLGWWIAKEARDLHTRTKREIGIRGQMVSVGDVLRQFPRGKTGVSQAVNPSNWDQILGTMAKFQAFDKEPNEYAGEQRIEDLTGKGGMDYLETSLEILLQQNLEVYGIPASHVLSVALRFRKDLTIYNV